MKEFVDWMDSAPLIIKIIFALPALDIIWVIYRVFKSALKDSKLGILLGIIFIIIGFPWLWLIDIISIAITKDNSVIWID